MSDLATIGRNTTIEFIDHLAGVPAKVDTGADSSAIWVSGLHVRPDGALVFCLLDPSSPLYTGEVITLTDYAVASVRSSNGQTQVRYRATFSVRINGKRLRVTFNLSDRSKNEFPALIGRRTLHGKFVVDVTKADHQAAECATTHKLRSEMQENPYEFYKKYHVNAQQEQTERKTS